MREYWSVLVISVLIMGIIPAKIAEKKGKDFGSWYIYGVCLFFFAMIHAIVLPEKDNNERNNEDLIKTVKSSIISEEDDVYSEIRYIDINCPIEVSGFEIKVNEKLGLTYCAVDFLNLSDKIVSSIKFTINCYNSFEQPIIEGNKNQVEALIQDQSANPKTHFGIDKLIPLLEYPSTRKVEVTIEKILFSDNSTWEKGDYELHKLKVNKISAEELKSLRNIAGDDAICYSEITDNTWTCICGRLNHLTDINCRRCDRDKEQVLDKYVSKEKIEKLENERKLRAEHEILEEEHKKLKEREQRKNLNKKILKLACIAFIVVIPIVVGVITNFTFSYKEYELKKYNIDVKNINSVLEDGGTYLSQSANDGDTERVRTLIKYGANVNLKNKRGITPLFNAAATGNTEVVKLLIENGADINGKSNTSTPLHCAATRGDEEVLKLLINKGANVNIRNHLGETPLNSAAACNVEAIRILMKKGADVNSRDNEGKTLLHKIADNNKKIEIAKLLIQNGADINIKDNIWGRTALHYSMNASAKEMAKLLIENGAYVNIKDNIGMTPIDIAEMK